MRRALLTLLFTLPAVTVLAAPAPTPAPKPVPAPVPTVLPRTPAKSGYVLTHEHPTYGMAFGGNYAFAGAPGNFKNGVMVKGYTAECGGCKAGSSCDHGEAKGSFTALSGSLGADMGPHKSHKGPLHDSNSHLRYSTEWVKAAFDPSEPELRDARMRIMVAFAVENEAMCEQLYYANKGKGGPGGDGYACAHGDSLGSLERQLEAIKAWVKENSSWMDIAYSAADARRIVNADKLAIVLGIESEYSFGAEDRTFDPVSRLNRYWDDGVRTFYLAHKINSRLAGADIYAFGETPAGKAVRATQAISGCFFYDDNVGPFPLANNLGHNFCDNNCGKNFFKGDKLGGLSDSCASKMSDISEANMADYVLARGNGVFNGFNVYPKPPGFTSAGGTTTGGSKVVDGIERNNLGLSHDGERVVREAMMKGMIVNIDHVSSKTRTAIHTISTRDFGGYPLNALHNNPNEMLVGNKGKLDTPFPHEYDFDEGELEFVRKTGGFFGVRVGPIDAKDYAKSGVTKDCPKTSTETAKVLAYLLDQQLPVGYSLDYGTVTQAVHSRTLAGCGLDLGPDRIHKYDAEVAEGLSHVGTMKYWHKELETIGLKSSYVSRLKADGVEAFLAMWEKSERSAKVGKQIPRQTFPSTPSNGGGANTNCKQDSDCAKGQFCTAGIPDLEQNACKSKKERGATCTTKRQCVSDRCSWGVCAEPDECRSNADCNKGEYCGDPIAGKATCKDLLAKGKACTKGTQCASGKCSFFTCD